MRRLSFLSVLLWAIGAAEAGGSADLTRIDRTIKKEPVYQGKPKYCLLVFGAQARARVWLVRDGNDYYIDRNGNGDLTETGKKVTWQGGRQILVAGDIQGDRKPGYTLSLRKFSSGMRLTLHDKGKRRYLVGDPDTEALVFADRASEAPVVHIGGAHSTELSYYGTGPGFLVLRVRVGTTGLGKGTFAAIVLPDVAPVAEIEFPASKPDAPQIASKAVLKER
jgi:hypothetical protein